MRPETRSYLDPEISEALRSLAAPVFAACVSDHPQGQRITVHVSSGAKLRALKAPILQSLSGIEKHNAVIRVHRPASLLRAKSLEAFVARLGGERIAYDPTGALSRSEALVDASRAVRDALGERVCGFYYAPMLRIFYVTLEKSKLACGATFRLSELAEIERIVLAALRAAFDGSEAACPAVRVGFGLPVTRLVPVDRLSVMGWRQSVLPALQTCWKQLTVAVLFGLGAASAAQAQDAAVSEANLKLRGSFGEVIDDYSWNVEAAFTAPLSERFGVAVEGGAGSNANNDYFGVGGHLFARDPDSYLLGVFGAYSEGTSFNVDATRVGGEFEFYLDQLTVSGSAGYQFSTILGDKSFGNLDFKWYATNNFSISAGGFGDEDKAYARGRLEWQPGFAALPGLAFHADGVFGEDDYQSVMFGLTYYFGTPVDLIDRHRRQDPEMALFGLFQAVQKEQQRIADELCAQYGTNC